MNWDDMVFENRNQTYGAYIIRRAYKDQVIRAFIITLMILAMLVLYPIIKKIFEPPPAPPATKQVIDITLSAPPPINPNTPEPPRVELPRPPESIKFVPPKVVDKDVPDKVPEIDVLLDTPTAPETS